MYKKLLLTLLAICSQNDTENDYKSSEAALKALKSCRRYEIIIFVKFVNINWKLTVGYVLILLLAW